MNIRKKIIQIGHKKAVLFISLFSIISSVLIYIPVGYLLEGEVKLVGIIISIIAPMIIAPSVSWHLLKLLVEINNLEVEMRELITFDSLTKVMSRNAFLTNAQTIYELAKREESVVSILYVDIDYFKKINDTYGHSIGDEVLKSFGKLATEHKRKSDLIGRLGGEEFAFILPKTDTKGAMDFADNLRNLIKQNVKKYNNIEIAYTVSIGVSIFDKSEANLDELINQADEALFLAKNAGRDCTMLYKAKECITYE